MCPLLRGETPPLPENELATLRDRLERRFGHRSVPTPSGPLLVVRVPTGRPDLLQDLEAATDHLPPLDLTGYRAAILLGDQGNLAVSIDMLQSLVSTRRATETSWVAHHRQHLDEWSVVVSRLPSDPERRLRAVIRVPAPRVAELGEPQFDQIAGLLPRIQEKSPGRCLPAFAYLVTQDDHVRIEGDRFFQELEERARRLRDREQTTARRKRESSYEIARGHIARLEERQNRRKQDEPRSIRTAPRTQARAYREDLHERSRLRNNESRRALQRPPDRRTPRPNSPFKPPGVSRPAEPERTQTPRTTRDPPERAPPAEPDRFRAAGRHTARIDHLKRLLREAGYEIRERLVVDEVPLTLAAARPEGYPRRVLVTFHEKLGADTARRILRVARGAGAELALAVTEETGEGVDRVTLATNLKVIAPEAVMGLRLD